MLALVVCSCIFGACSDELPEHVQLPDLPTQPIIVLYENDVHCSIDGYPMLVSYRDECLSGTDYVSTISAFTFPESLIYNLKVNYLWHYARRTSIYRITNQIHGLNYDLYRQ